MRTRPRLCALCAALAILLAAPGGAQAAGPVARGQALVVAYLYNFALYTEWPQAPSAGLGVCVAGEDPFGTALDAIAEKRLRGQPVWVRLLGQETDFSGCHVLFLGTAAPAQRARIAQALAGQPILTVAGGDEGERDGEAAQPMILLRPEGERFVFEIDLTAAKAAGLVLSSRLLRLAREVR